MPLSTFENKKVARVIRGLIEISSCVCFAISLGGCAETSQQEAVDSVSWALSRSLSVSDDTFVNSLHADNNNGASDSIYTGESGQGGVMRGLVQFAMPPALQGRVIITNVKLSMTTRALGNGAAGPALVQSLQAVTQPWVQGTGVGNVSMLNTVGQICGGSVSGVTWNQSDCVGAPGSGTTWSTPGATVSAAISGQVTTPGVIDTAVVWDSAVAGNALMNADVQGWLDTPSSNNGWRIASSDEVTPSFAQRFYSSESGTANAPALAIAYDCKAGFDTASSDCTTCTVAAQAKCVTAQGNSCVDGGGPSTTYSCNCSNPAYKSGQGADGAPACLDNNACTTNHCTDNGDSTATCIDNVAPAAGYSCACSPSYSFNGVSCAIPGGTGGTSGTGGASSSSVAGSPANGGATGSGGTSGGASSVSIGGTSSSTAGRSSTAGYTGAGGATTAGTGAAVAGTGALTGDSSATGGANPNSSSTSSSEAVTGGACTCRVGGYSGPARLPTMASIASLLGALSIRRSSRRWRYFRGGNNSWPRADYESGRTSTV